MTRIRGGRPPSPPASRRPPPTPSPSSARGIADVDEAALAHDVLFDAALAPDGGSPARRSLGAWIESGRDAIGSVISGLASRWSGGVLGSILGSAALLGGAAGPALAAQSVGPPPEPTGSVEARPVYAAAYVVAAGDTLSQIAATHGVSLKKLLLYNEDVLNPDLIFPGQRIVIPPGAKVVARAAPPGAASASAADSTATPVAATGSTATTASAADSTATPAPAADSSATAASTRESDTTSRILRWVDARITEAATRSSTRVRHDVDLGALGRGDLELRPLVRLSADYTAARASFEAPHRAAGREVVWLETTLGAKLTPPAEGIVLSSDATATPGASVELTVTRPLAYASRDVRLPRLAAQLAERLTQPPLSSATLLALETGSRVTVRGEGSLALTETTPTTALRGKLELRVDRLEGTRVEARLSTDGHATIIAESGGTRIDGIGERRNDRTFTLDLATEGGRAALSALLRLDGAGALDLANAATPGVTVDAHAGVVTRAVGLGHTTAAGERASLRTRVETRVDDGGRTRTAFTSSELGRGAPDATEALAARVTHETRASAGPGRELPTSAADVLASDHPTALDTTLRAGVDARWAGATDAPSTARASLERRVISERTVDATRRRESGSLEVGARLSRALGHVGGERTVRYELGTPLEHPASGSLPLDAASFRALPASSSLELVFARSTTGALRSTVALSGEQAVRARVVAVRGAGDAVEVRVVRYESAQHRVGAAIERGPAERRVALSAHDGGSTRADVDRSFTLDLSKADHATALARLLEGDAESAARALGEEAPAVSRDRLRELSAKLGVEAPGEWSFGLELTRRVHEPAALLVSGSVDRAALGESRWIERVGLISPKVTVSTTVPVGGTAGSVKSGLSADGLVELRQLAPEGDDRVLTLGADDVLTWTRGSEVTVRGRGRATGFVDAGVGHSVTAGPVSVGARASVSESHAVDKGYVLDVRRTEGTRARVSLRETAASSDAIAAVAKIGVTTDLKAAIELPAGSARNDAIIKVMERADRALTERLTASIEGSLSRTTEVDRKTEVEVDLLEPRGRSVFEALVRFDAENARRLAESGLELSDTDTVARRSHASASILGWDAFRVDTARIDAHTRATGPAGDVTTDASSFRSTSRTLLGRERALDWKAVAVQRSDAPAPELMYRVQFTDKDDLTSRRQVESLMSLVDGLELRTVETPRVERAPQRGLMALLGEYAQHGKTEVALDVYLSKRGIDTLRTTSQESAWRAFGDVVSRGGARPGWARDDVGRDARVLLAEHVDQSRPAGGEGGDSSNASYWWLTDHNLHQDSDSFRNARSFTEMVRRVGSSSSPAEWNRAFADLGEQTGYPFYDAVAAMHRLTGPSGVLAHRLAMTGPAVRIEAVGAGLTEVPLIDR